MHEFLQRIQLLLLDGKHENKIPFPPPKYSLSKEKFEGNFLQNSGNKLHHFNYYFQKLYEKNNVSNIKPYRQIDLLPLSSVHHQNKCSKHSPTFLLLYVKKTNFN